MACCHYLINKKEDPLELTDRWIQTDIHILHVWGDLTFLMGNYELIHTVRGA